MGVGWGWFLEQTGEARSEPGRLPLASPLPWVGGNPPSLPTALIGHRVTAPPSEPAGCKPKALGFLGAPSGLQGGGAGWGGRLLDYRRAFPSANSCQHSTAWPRLSGLLGCKDRVKQLCRLAWWPGPASRGAHTHACAHACFHVHIEMCTHTSIHVCIYVQTCAQGTHSAHTCIHAHRDMCAHRHVCTDMYAHADVYTHVHTCTHTHAHTDMRTHMCRHALVCTMHTCMHMQTHTHTQTCTHLQMCTHVHT